MATTTKLYVPTWKNKLHKALGLDLFSLKEIKNPLIMRRVSGQSMEPVLRSGQIIIASRWHGRLTPEAVVIIHHDKIDKIKRIQKMQNGRIYVVGDNARASIDSRSFGWLPQNSVVAKVIWPRIS